MLFADFAVVIDASAEDAADACFCQRCLSLLPKQAAFMMPPMSFRHFSPIFEIISSFRPLFRPRRRFSPPFIAAARFTLC